MALATGLFNANLNPAELNMRSFAANILRLFPNGSAPLFAMSSQSGKASAKSTTHGYFSKTMTFISQSPTAQVLVGGTTILVTSTAGMVEGMVLFNRTTRENVRITDVVSAVELTVTRAFGRVAAVQMETTETLIAVGTAYEEGSVRPTPRRLTTVYVPNYTQIFRNAWALTDSARASMAEAGISNIQENRQDCSLFHAADAEAAILYGQPKMDTTGTSPIHATQGIIDAIEQYAPANTNTAASTTTFAQLVALVEPAFQYSTDMSNPKERVIFGDSQAIKVINDIGRLSGVVQIMNKQTNFGMNFTQFGFYKGTVNLIEHPLMNGMGATGLAVVMDMAALKLAYLEGRDTKLEEYGTGGKIVESGVDSVGGSLTTEFAVELTNPFSCAVIYGLTAGAA